MVYNFDFVAAGVVVVVAVVSVGGEIVDNTVLMLAYQAHNDRDNIS